MSIKPFYKDDYVVEYEGHVLKVLGQLPAESVHMVMTSIPYWGLRDYQLEPQVWDDPGGCEHEWKSEMIYKDSPTRKRSADCFTKESTRKDERWRDNTYCVHCNAWLGSLGLEPTPELYIQHIVQVFRELWRVGRKDCTVWLNIGDSYAGGGRAGKNGQAYGGLEAQNRCNTQVKWGPPTGKIEGLKPKDLCMIPARVALALQADGWWLRSDICWNKPNPMPESCTDRPTKSHEYVFLLTKSGTSQFWSHRDHAGTREKPKADYRWVDQITEEEVSVAPPDWKETIICPNCEGKGRASVDLSYEFLGVWTEYWAEDECPVCEGKKKIQKWKRINLWKGHDYFYDMDAVREAHKEPWRGKGETEKNNWSVMCNRGSHETKREYNPAGRNLRSVWTIATEPFPQAHFATFPAKLCEIAIKAGTSERGCCPECGAPWVRVVEKKASTMNIRVRDVKAGRAKHPTYLYATENEIDNYGEEEMGESKTIGWKPSCECNRILIRPGGRPHAKAPYQPIPCTVLDPFSGSGRALTTARKLGRKAIGIDLKREYLEMPLEELKRLDRWEKKSFKM